MAEYKNPNQQGAQDMKPLLVMSVVFIVIFAGLKYFKPQKPAEQPPAAIAQTQQPSAAAPTQAQAPSHTPGQTQTSAAVNAVQASAETQTIVENELYRIAFTNRGAQVTSWVLKKYKDSNGQPLDLVQPQAAKLFGFPLSLYTYDAATTAKLNQALFVASTTGTLNAPGTLTFNYSDGALTARKTFAFDASYVLHADAQASMNGAPVRALLSWPSGLGDQEAASPRRGIGQSSPSTTQLDLMQSGKTDHVATKKVIGGATLNGPFDWAGISDLYFGAVFLPDNPQTATVVSFNHAIQVPKDPTKQDPNNTVAVPVLGTALGDTSGPTQARLYVGPKGIEILKTVHGSGANAPSLESLVDFGFFGPIAKALFYSLHFIFEHIVASWGWAIVLLTVLINILLLPLRVVTMKSSLKMQRIQPQIAAIKERYKKYKMNDPQYAEMNSEVMALQKREGVNMFGGCLPMLIQFPLLFAFYRMLPNVVELRQAHWLWLPDLSSADPYHILPVLMIVSQFLVQFYTPSPGVDPAQQRMMAFTMPAFTGFITWNYASGLALYWAIGNLIGIAQQAVMNRTSLGREMKDIAAKRARRKSGTSAKTIPARR